MSIFRRLTIFNNIRVARRCKPKLFAVQKCAYRDWSAHEHDENIAMYDSVEDKAQDPIAPIDSDDDMLVYNSSTVSSNFHSTTENYYNDVYDEDNNTYLNILNDLDTTVCAKRINHDDNAESMMLYDWPHGYVNYNTSESKVDNIDKYAENTIIYDCSYENTTHDPIASMDEDDDVMITHNASILSSGSNSTTDNYYDVYDEDVNKSYELNLNILNDIYTNVCAKIIGHDDNAESMMIYDWPHGYIKHDMLQSKCDHINNYGENMSVYDWPHGYLKLNV